MYCLISCLHLKIKCCLCGPKTLHCNSVQLAYENIVHWLLPEEFYDNIKKPISFSVVIVKLHPSYKTILSRKHMYIELLCCGKKPIVFWNSQHLAILSWDFWWKISNYILETHFPKFMFWIALWFHQVLVPFWGNQFLKLYYIKVMMLSYFK